MALGMDLLQKQTLKLTLTPELRQSINILQFSSLELVDFLHQQTVENPVLVVRDHSRDDFGKRHDSKTSYGYQTRDSDFNPIQHCTDSKITLENHLVEQLMTIPNITPIQINIMKFLIGNLNQHGFLEIEPAITARIFTVPLAEIEKVIKMLQSLDPIGVGARNLADCLLIQIRSQSHPHPLAFEMISHHLEDLAAKHFQKIAKVFNVSVTEIQEAADYIKTLNPRPCIEFHHEMTHYITPDLIVRKIKNEYVTIVNDRMMPDLSITHFHQLNQEDMISAEDFLKEKYQEAMILMNGMAQRKQTLYRVTKAIVDSQKDFLEKGMSGLKPMTLKDISEQLGYHESTISRATSNKYIQTPHGLFKLKSLFTTGISRSNCLETDSSASVKETIKGLIDKENKLKPLSDQKLVHLLEQNGILISRRTVAKYREEIGIPGSSKRKRY
jgi:RNA polymerase sigma-54 factor